MNYLEIINYLNSTKLDNDIYLEDDNLEKNRYRFLIDETYKRFGDGDYHLISSPGRTEIGGNHTDHQHGNTLSATIAVDNVCACKKSDDNIVTFYDSKLGEVTVDLSDLVMREEEKNTSIAIIRGIAYKLKEKGYELCALKRGDDALDIFDYTFKEKSLFMLGGEKRGISSSLMELCDKYLYISYGSDFRNALNACNAAAVVSTLIYKQKRLLIAHQSSYFSGGTCLNISASRGWGSSTTYRWNSAPE